MKDVTIVGCAFVAKYPEGGGNFSVPLQYVLGLRRMQVTFLWLEVLESTGDPDLDNARIAAFRRRLKTFGLEKHFCLILLAKGRADLEGARFFGRSRRQFKDLVAGPTTLLNLSYSIKPPLLDLFTRLKLCSLDPTEVCFWMQRMEMGQSFHHEFWTIGLNLYGKGSKVPTGVVGWKTYFPLVDSSIFRIQPRPPVDRFSTIGQWYWDGMIEFGGEWKDFSKRAAFEPYLPLARRIPDAVFELAMNLTEDDPDRARLAGLGWRHVVPHNVARSPRLYYDYVARSSAEFSAVKLESHMASGWLSDRSAVYLAMGRPVITEPTAAESYLPDESGYLFVSNLEQAEEAVRRVRSDWKALSRQARRCAVECFDSVVNLEKILA